MDAGKPDHKAFIDRFNRSYRAGVRGGYGSDSIEQTCEITATAIREYSEQRPPGGTGRAPALTFLPRQIKPGKSAPELGA
jgi:hypothetical protein